MCCCCLLALFPALPLPVLSCSAGFDESRLLANGWAGLHSQVKPEEIELVRRDYAANGGWETFLAYEDPRQDILVGLLRLRKVSGAAKSRQAELQGRCSIVRELHVYGTAVAVSARDATKQQHQVCTPALASPTH